MISVDCIDTFPTLPPFLLFTNRLTCAPWFTRHPAQTLRPAGPGACPGS
jgi:hypothetical protein